MTGEEEKDNGHQWGRCSDRFSLFPTQANRDPTEYLEFPRDEYVQDCQGHEWSETGQDEGSNLLVIDEVAQRE